jgi:hypothetical protein
LLTSIKSRNTRRYGQGVNRPCIRDKQMMLASSTSSKRTQSGQFRLDHPNPLWKSPVTTPLPMSATSSASATPELGTRLPCSGLAAALFRARGPARRAIAPGCEDRPCRVPSSEVRGSRLPPTRSLHSTNPRPAPTRARP